jgi:hypothetical protein
VLVATCESCGVTDDQGDELHRYWCLAWGVEREPMPRREVVIQAAVCLLIMAVIGLCVWATVMGR